MRRLLATTSLRSLFFGLLSVLLIAATPLPAMAGKGGGKGNGGGGGGGGGGSSLPTVAVSLGDSFISGEGGRWAGNSNDGLDPDRDGTDRAYRSAWYGWWYDYEAIYPGTVDNACHRSDVAEIHSAALAGSAVDKAVNLACSGATTANVFRASNGGLSFKGEVPQADRLAALAADHDVELVVLSIGGNDLGFSNHLTDCITSFTTGSAPCNTSAQAEIDAAMPNAMINVAKAITEVQAALSSAGQEPGSYRFVLQSYPSPIPRASDNRYPESNWSRLNTGGCPLWDADSDWARDSLVPQIDAELRDVASGAGIEFLSLASAFDGREACATASSLVNGDSDTPSSARHEWMRFLVSGAVQGDLQESLHPNAFGQQALGRCLALVWSAGPGEHACTNARGKPASTMRLSRL